MNEIEEMDDIMSTMNKSYITVTQGGVIATGLVPYTANAVVILFGGFDYDLNIRFYKFKGGGYHYYVTLHNILLDTIIKSSDNDHMTIVLKQWIVDYFEPMYGDVLPEIVYDTMDYFIK